eukprot:2616085-Ditylum_brightwellii.AAC.1
MKGPSNSSPAMIGTPTTATLLHRRRQQRLEEELSPCNISNPMERGGGSRSELPRKSKLQA